MVSEKERNPHDGGGGCCSVTLQNLKVGACILYYYGSSTALILYNKWLFKVHGFEYPLIVTAFHFSLCFLFASSWVWWTKSGNMCSVGSCKVVKRTVVIGIMTGMDVSLSNLSYLMVSIPFMEMVKSTSPIWVLLLSFAAGIEKPTFSLIAAISLMAAGLALSIEGEMNFNPTGFAMCLGAGFLAALRVVVSHTVLHGQGMDGLDPISLLYIAAPSSVVSILPAAIPLEMESIIESHFFRDSSLFWTTWWSILAGGILAINLNFSEFVLIGRTSALTLNVAGNIKVVAVSALSVLFFKAKISALNISGYAVCILGVWIYNMRKTQEGESSIDMADGEELLPRDQQGFVVQGKLDNFVDDGVDDEVELLECDEDEEQATVVV